MAPLRVLQVASYAGNIGDNANHMGFRPWFERMAGRPVEWAGLEIREFYWKERRWDDDFAALANTYDLVVIGGGNYFELWVDDSPTGTSIAIPPAVFGRIRTPILFNALGVDPGQGASGASLSRFRAFLDTLFNSHQYLVTVRNDGAIANLSQHVGRQYADKAQRVPDGGFFVPAPEAAPPPHMVGGLAIVLCIASDMPDVRFKHFGAAGGRAGFAREIAAVIEGLGTACTNSRFTLVPHICRDLELIGEVVNLLADRLRRTRLAVAPFGSGDDAARAALRVYAAADLVLAMRYHANVCPIGLGRETLGLANYTQISAAYTELGQQDRVIDVSRPGFSEFAVGASLRALHEPRSFSGSPADAKATVVALRANFEPVLSAWLGQNALLAEAG